MPTILAHPAVVVALGPAFARRGVGPKLWLVGAVCTVVPDLDTIGYFLGVPYGSLLGHRGLTHSLLFALALAALLAAPCRRLAPRASWIAVAAFLFLCTASHGLLDACTDGGLGVALFSPFDATRWFFPFRPIQVSPIGVTRFLDGAAWAVLMSELRWVVLPSVVAGALLWYAGGRPREDS